MAWKQTGTKKEGIGKRNQPEDTGSGLAVVLPLLQQSSLCNASQMIMSFPLFPPLSAPLLLLQSASV